MSPKEKLEKPDGPRGPQSVLEHMYNNEEFSDLTVKASTGWPFKVHKSVVCAASPFFHAACTSQSGHHKTPSHIIELPENFRIVEAILSHYYSVPIRWTKASLYDYHFIVTLDIGQDLIGLRIAIDKYGIDSMAATAEKTLSTFLFRAAELGKEDVVVQLGRQLFDEPCDFFTSSRLDAARATAKVVSEILRNDNSFEVWHGNAEYMQRTLQVREEMRLAELE